MALMVFGSATPPAFCCFEEWAKKLENRLNRENRKKNRTEKKNRLNFWKNRPVRFGFGFITKKPKKPNRTEIEKKPEKKPSQTEKNRAKTEKTRKTEPNRFEPVFALKKPNRTETGRFDLVSVRFRFFQKKNSVWLLFLIKTEPNRTENDYL